MSVMEHKRRSTRQSTSSRGRSIVNAEGDDEEKTDDQERRQSEFDTDDQDVDDEEPEIFSIDSDYKLTEDFNYEKAKKQLLNFEDCTRLDISLEEQKDIGIEVGINVTAEYPWKQVKKEVLLDFLNADTPKVNRLRSILSSSKTENLILVGYSPILSEKHETDMFLIFHTEEAAILASDLIRQMEAYERRIVKGILYKRPKRWKSKGSEKEISDMQPFVKPTQVDVEVQSVFPLKTVNRDFAHKPRLASQVRDGYVELVPNPKHKYENVTKRRVDIQIQAAFPRNNTEQQTEPTFPSNAWSQYLYEILPEDNAVEEEPEEEEAPRPKGKPGTPAPPPPPKPPVLPSPQVQKLINMLDFNIIDLYRNDYPSIAKKSVNKYAVPFIQELFCFVDMNKSLNRSIIDADWHPSLTGIIAISYAFSTMFSISGFDEKIDVVKRVVVEPNTVLLWSFDDTLRPKLELEAPREVTTLSFCPYDANILIGGMANGQIILWDLKNRLERVENVEILTSAQQSYRAIMRSFFSWTKEGNRDLIVRATALSAFDTSQKGIVTNIRWLNRKHYVTPTGQAKVAGEYDDKRFFVTTALDGTIAFWDLDTVQEIAEKQLAATIRTKKLPDNLLDEVSEYSILDKVFKPTFMIMAEEPILTFRMDRGSFSYKALEPIVRTNILKRISYSCVHNVQDTFNNTIVVSGYTGHLRRTHWDGFDFNQGSGVNKETIQTYEDYVQIHDGPITQIRFSPTIRNFFLTVGNRIVALWKENVYWTPIIWVRRPSKVTDGKWSLTRPGVFFITRDDGSFEVWDLTTRCDEPCLVTSLGGYVLSYIMEHRLILPRLLMGVADYNSSFRMLSIPKSFVDPIPNETEVVKDYISRELDRKTKLDKWQNDWYNRNADVREAKRIAAEAAQIELENMLKEQRELEELQARVLDEEKKKQQKQSKKSAVFDLPEKLEKKWDEMNLKRLMKVLMSMKMVDPDLLAIWTKPEKDRIAFDNQKRQAIEDSFARVEEDVATIRSRLLPIQKEDIDRVKNMEEVLHNIIGDEIKEKYEVLQESAKHYVQTHTTLRPVSYFEILQRAQQKREILNKSLGINTHHLYSYETRKYKIQPRATKAKVETVDIMQGISDMADDEDAEATEEGEGDVTISLPIDG